MKITRLERSALPESDCCAGMWHRLRANLLLAFRMAGTIWITNYIYTPIQKYFYFENPIVIRIPEGRLGAGSYLMAVGNYTDASLGITHATCGYATSPDGLHWSEMRPLNPGFGDCATVLSLLPEAEGGYTMFITNHDKVEERAGELQSSGTWVVPSYERVSRVALSVAPR